jgi:hypothetical protein
VAILVALFVLKNRQLKGPDQSPKSIAVDLDAVPSSQAVLDYGRLENDQNLSRLMQERKDKYGITDGLDMIVTSDESLKVGNETVKMGDIVDEARLQRGELVEKNLGRPRTLSQKDAEDYGVHVVQPGENIWNIHFQLLKEFFKKRQINLSPMADEPGRNGFSSGVGKILKFSERMVYIYNMKDRRLESDINQIQPLSKVVVYNMKEVFSLLESIDVSNVNQIRFDGETIWISNE